MFFNDVSRPRNMRFEDTRFLADPAIENHDARERVDRLYGNNPEDVNKVSNRTPSIRGNTDSHVHVLTRMSNGWDRVSRLLWYQLEHEHD